MKKVMIISSMLFIGMMMFNNVMAQNDNDEVEFNEPCSDYTSSANMIYGRGIGEDYEQQTSSEDARTAAERKNTSRESLRRIEGLTMTEVDQTTGFRIVCRKTTTYSQNGERLYKTYMVVELNEDVLLSSIYKRLQKDPEMSVDADYQSFKKEFDEHFKNKSQESLEENIGQ